MTLIVMDMDAGDDACAADLTHYPLQVGHAIRIGRAPFKVADGLREGQVMHLHQPETAHPSIANMLVNVLRRGFAHFVVRISIFAASATLDTPRKAVILLHGGNTVQQILRGCHDEGRPHPLRCDLLRRSSLKNISTRARLAIDSRVGIGSQKVDRDSLVPGYVKPVSKVLPGANGELNEQCLFDRILPSWPEKGTRPILQLFECKADVTFGDFQTDRSFESHMRKGYNQPVAVAPHCLSRESRDLSGVNQLQLIVIRSTLSGREHWNIHTHRKAFLAARLVDKTLRLPILCNYQQKFLVLNNHSICSGSRCGNPRRWNIRCSASRSRVSK